MPQFSSLTSPTASSQADLLVSAALHLMSNYSLQQIEGAPCVKLACVIERHFKALSTLPDLAPVVQATCQQMCEHWARIASNGVEQAGRKKAFGAGHGAP